MMTLRLPLFHAGRPAHSIARVALAAAAFLVPAFVPPAALGQATGDAVEYYHAGFNHYFITARANEIGLLDGGAFGGAWRRTGQTIPVWTAGGPSTAEACRFFTEAFPPKSSHFYTPLARECAGLRQGTTWQFEDVAFHLKVDALGNCPAGSVPLYRLYNNVLSGAPNHRYTTSRVIVDQMVAQGWTAEGAGAQTVFACVPSAPAAAVPSGWFEGTTGTGAEFLGLMLDDGSFYFLHSALDAVPASAGLIEGRAVFTGNAFTTVQARDYSVLPVPGESAATVSGTVVPQTSINGTIQSGGRTTTFTARYEHAIGGPISLAQIAGQYTGLGASAEAYGPMTMTLSPSGGLSGNYPGCSIDGTAVPRLTSGFMDATVTYGGGCALGQAATVGVALYNTAGAGELMIFTHRADGTGVFVFVGER